MIHREDFIIIDKLVTVFHLMISDLGSSTVVHQQCYTSVCAYVPVFLLCFLVVCFSCSDSLHDAVQSFIKMHCLGFVLFNDSLMLDNPTDIGVWRLCVWERKTRSTVLMKREPLPPSTRKKGEREKVKSFPVSGKWCTERLREKKRSRMLKAVLKSQLWVSLYYNLVGMS